MGLVERGVEVFMQVREGGCAALSAGLSSYQRPLSAGPGGRRARQPAEG